MDDSTILILCGVFGAYVLYKNWKNTIPERNDVVTTKSELTPTAKLLQTEVTGFDYLVPTKYNTTYKFSAGDWSKLNIAQRVLYSLGVSPRWIFE